MSHLNVIVQFSPKFSSEKRYTLEVLLGYFNNIQIEWKEVEGLANYQLIIEGKTIRIEDAFFNSIANASSYINKKHLPQQYVELTYNKHNLIVLFAHEKATVLKEGEDIFIKGDIIASAFFMLSRWEEVIPDELDQHERFPDEAATAIKLNFHRRAIVNEYIFFLRDLINDLTGAQLEINQKYQLYLSHDVDEIFRLRPFKQGVKVLICDLLIRKSLSLFFHNLRKIVQHKSQDPSYKFDYFMTISEDNNILSHFYFIPAKKGEFDYRYEYNDPEVIHLMDNISKRGHIIGIHPSYNTYKNYQQLEIELNRLNQLTNHTTIEEGRQHFLRFDVLSTWGNWEKLGLKMDGTLGFSHNGGFRAGMCYNYPAFDLNKQQKMNLEVQPLICMDGAILKSTQTPEEFTESIYQLFETVKYFNGNMTLLWHNSSLDHYDWKNIAEYYPQIINKLS